MSGPGVTLIGVPLDLGAGRRGVDMGPSAFRVAEIERNIRGLGFVVEDAGDLRVRIPETQDPGDPRAKYLTEIKEGCETLRDRLGGALGQGKRPGNLGGDPSVPIAPLAARARFFN